MSRGGPVCIYHFPCADGFTAAWAFWKRFGDDGMEFVPGSYGEDPDFSNYKGRDVYLVDFSYKRPRLKELASIANRVIIIDHHKTAAEDLAGLEDELDNVFVHFDMDRSGAMMAWNYLNDTEDVPTLVKYVQDRDLWRFDLPWSKEASSYIFAHDYTWENWDRLQHEFETAFSKVMSGGAAIDQKHMKDVKELMAASKRRIILGGVDVPVVNLPYTMSSEGCNILAQGEPFAASYFDKGDHRMWSLRSVKGGRDVSKVAAMYGGGGHENAAGFQSGLDWCGDIV